MKRWRNLSSEGWYSGDLHLHVDRFEKKDNQSLAQVLEAEDLNAGVDLQLMYDLVFIMHQLYGEEGRHQEGDHMVVPGQETPRGSQWGHFNAIDVSKFFPAEKLYGAARNNAYFSGGRCCGGYEPCHVGSVWRQ